MPNALSDGQSIYVGLKKLGGSGQLEHLAHLIHSQLDHKHDRFNIFDVLRVTWLELPHSNFLAFLLDPEAKHGWHTTFLELFLGEACGYDIQGFGPNHMEVLREWKHIDILLRDESRQLLVIIENKITSDEGEGQLETYWREMKAYYPGWTQIGIFLTPRGAAPSHSAYKAVGYHDIVQLIDRLLQKPISGLNSDDAENVVSSVRQYAQMLRRHIVADKQVAELSQRIIHEHHATLRHLNEFYASWQKEMVRKIADKLKAYIQKSSELYSDESFPGYIRFGITSLQHVPELNAKHYVDRKLWTPSGQLLLFVAHNQTHSLRVELFLFCEQDDIRSRMQPVRDKLEHLAAITSPFHAAHLSGPWIRIYSRELLPETDSGYLDCDEDKLLSHVGEGWNDFITSDFPYIEKALQSIFSHE